MTSLVWDKVGERRYEAGLDRGVLYKSDSSGVAWNGLVSVDEALDDITAEPRMFDGVKYLDEPVVGDFAATLTAFTYPDEFMEYEGIESMGDGLYVGDQQPKRFGLTYRTLVGNDVEGTDHGYQVHIIYNLTAVPSTLTYSTLSETVSPNNFSWSLTAVPEPVPGFRPTAHFILDSRFLPGDILAVIEDILYGSDETSSSAIYDGGYVGPEDRGLIDGGYPWSEGDELPGTTVDPGVARLPPVSELIFLTTFFGPKVIVPDEVNGLSTLLPGEGDLTQTSEAGIFAALPETRLVPSDVPGLYVLMP